MAEGNRLGSGPQIDFIQLFKEAHNRWLRPAEILEILKNHRMFVIQSEPPNRPPSGSVFLFDRKLLRYFRRDGHNWQKKKDGKTVKEAHERLKAGSIDVLHCYYAHGHEDDNFQRRSYWMLEENWTHIVFVHYLNVKGSKGSSSRTKDVQVQPALTITQDDCMPGPSAIPQQIACMDAESPNSTQSSEYEDAGTADNCSASPGYDPFLEVSRNNLKSLADTSHLEPYIPDLFQGTTDNLQGFRDTGYDFIALAHADLLASGDVDAGPYNRPSTSTDLHFHSIWKNHLPEWPMHTDNHNNIAKDDMRSSDLSMEEFVTGNIAANRQDGIKHQLIYPGERSLGNSSMDIPVLQNIPVVMGKNKHSTLGNQRSLDLSKGDDGLKKYDSFSRWMCRELEAVDDSFIQSSSAIWWDEVENGSVDEDSSLSHHGHVDSYVLSPSLSEDQLFSIIGFSPSWAYAGLQTKVSVTGTFLSSKDEVERCPWSCMFGEVEVPAEVLADGVLQCFAPQHKAGLVPFYVTCSNRVACSEIREFEFKDMCPSEMLLQERFKKMISLESVGTVNHMLDSFGDKAAICHKICLLLEDTSGDSSGFVNNHDSSSASAEFKVLQRNLKENLCSWLLHKVVLEDANGPSVLDEEGQSIIHLAAALDYDWAISPIVAAGVGVDFRDVSGWCALHWAAYYGREKTVVTLISHEASPGLLTDPTAEFPSPRTPADLASSNGHKGIAGFLAKCSLTSHLSALNVSEEVRPDAHECPEDSEDKFTSTVPFNEGELMGDSSLKYSLNAVRDATQAHARIFQAFRVQSFHRKQISSYEDESTADNHVLSRLAVKPMKAARNTDRLQAAAVRIQNKFRGWKGRRDFLVIRQHVVKIQAHVRGYQVRKKNKIFWLRVVHGIIMWKRRAQCPRLAAAPTEDTPMSVQAAEDDDIDLLKVGRKQSEVRFAKALARVKSMVQYPEAREQYRRLVTGVEEYKSKASESILDDPLDSIDMEMIAEIDDLLYDDAEMPVGG